MKTELIYTGSGQYVGKTMCGFTNLCEYSIKINKGLYGYTVEDVINDGDEHRGCIQYASERSLRKNWLLEEELRN